MQRGRAIGRWTLAAAYLGGIWWASSRTLEVTALPAFEGADKLLHAAVWLGLALVLYWALLPVPGLSRGVRLLVVLVVAVGWGVLDEVHQSWVPGRDPDVLDALADAVGAGLGVTLAGFSERWSRAKGAVG